MNENSDNYGRMLRQEPADDIQSVKGRVGVLVLTAAIATACVDDSQLNLSQLSNAPPTFVEHELSMTQELVNDAPLGPGIPQPSTHCPTGPGNWFAGSGRSTATSNVFGELEQVELYCVNRDLSQLSGGLATWTDVNGDTIDRWDGLTGAAFISGTQNGDGTATLTHEGKVYLPRN
jgi:hypothetical protein